MAFWNRRRREKKEQEAAELAEQMRLAQEEFDRGVHRHRKQYRMRGHLCRKRLMIMNNTGRCCRKQATCHRVL